MANSKDINEKDSTVLEEAETGVLGEVIRVLVAKKFSDDGFEEFNGSGKLLGELNDFEKAVMTVLQPKTSQYTLLMRERDKETRKIYSKENKEIDDNLHTIHILERECECLKALIYSLLIKRLDIREFGSISIHKGFKISLIS